MITSLLEVPALFKPILWLSIISAILAIFTIVSIILRDGRDVIFFVLSAISWITAAGFYNMLVEILKLVNEELLCSEVILSNITLVCKVLLISVSIILISAGAIAASCLMGVSKKEEEKIKAETEK